MPNRARLTAIVKCTANACEKLVVVGMPESMFKHEALLKVFFKIAVALPFIGGALSTSFELWLFLHQETTTIDISGYDFSSPMYYKHSIISIIRYGSGALLILMMKVGEKNHLLRLYFFLTILYSANFVLFC